MLVAATWVPAHRAARAAGGSTLQVLLALDAVLVAGAVLVLADARAWERLAQEGGIIEWGNGFAFAVAADEVERGILFQRR